MYYNVPGQQHMQLLAPGHHRLTTTLPRPTTDAAPHTRQRVDPLVRQAIGAAFGGYDPATMTAARFSQSVRTHIRAYRRTQLQQLQLRAQKTRKPPVVPQQLVRVVTCHSGDGGEFYGTLDKGGRRLAFAARLRGGKLESFKILETAS